MAILRHSRAAGHGDHDHLQPSFHRFALGWVAHADGAGVAVHLAPVCAGGDGIVSAAASLASSFEEAQRKRLHCSSVRVWGWRYTAWVYFNTTHLIADWNATQSNVPPVRSYIFAPLICVETRI